MQTRIVKLQLRLAGTRVLAHTAGLGDEWLLSLWWSITVIVHKLQWSSAGLGGEWLLSLWWSITVIDYSDRWRWSSTGPQFQLRTRYAAHNHRSMSDSIDSPAMEISSSTSTKSRTQAQKQRQAINQQRFRDKKKIEKGTSICLYCLLF